MSLSSAQVAELQEALAHGEGAELRWPRDGEVIQLMVRPIDGRGVNAAAQMLSWSRTSGSVHCAPRPSAAKAAFHEAVFEDRLDRRRLRRLVHDLTEGLSLELAVPRVSVWLLAGCDELSCYDSFTRAEGRHRSGAVWSVGVASYLDRLARVPFIDACEVASDPRLAGIRERFLEPESTVALLDVPIRIAGELLGVVRLEHTERRHVWSESELGLMRAVAVDLAAALEHVVRVDAEQHADHCQRVFASLFDACQVGVRLFDRDGTLLRSNDYLPFACDDWGAGDGVYCLNTDVAAANSGLAAAFRSAVIGEDVQTVRHCVVGSGDKDLAWLDTVLFVVPAGSGQDAQVLGLSWNAAEAVERDRQMAELSAQLRQSHKLEAVGQLAGGVAHDFNNVLTAVRGFADMLAMDTAAEDPRTALIGEIRSAADRGGDLTRQMLTFARGHISQSEVLDATATVADVMPMVERLVEANIDLEFVTGESVAIRADRGQLQQVVMNLIINARDAQPVGGRIRVRVTRCVHAKIDECARIEVEDEGCGMSPETQARIFDPFYSTKAVGRGTGLGLSTVYGIVTNAGGEIEVDSEEGRGTRFRIYWPVTRDELAPETALTVHPGLGNGERILVVEDDRANRNMTVGLLTRLGYEAVAAENGARAIVEYERNGPFDLLLTDVVMPGISGRQLSDTLHSLAPDLPVVFTSGYTSGELARHGVTHGNVRFLAKPYSTEQLGEVVRLALSESGRPGGGRAAMASAPGGGEEGPPATAADHGAPGPA
ncbi:MAG: response regulator [Planctomycetes bacterium]|nr:response regulator [Planctomycetota bacterium]